MIKELNNQELDNFISKQNYSQFLQSSLWGNFQKELGNKIWQIGIDPSTGSGHSGGWFGS